MALSDALLHPIRLRIVQAFLGRPELTTGDLRQYLADVPPATLYRQITVLLDAQILEVVEERKVRGAVERTFVLRPAAAMVDAQQAAAMSAEEHRRGFLTFVAGLVGDFDRYLGQDHVDLARDLVGYRQHGAYLTDTEMNDFITDLRAIIQPRLDLPPAAGRTRRLVTTILMPGIPHGEEEEPAACRDGGEGD